MSSTSSMKMREYVYPLSAFDVNCVGIGSTIGYVLTKVNDQPYDPTPLADAAERVAQKWPLLAARLIRDELQKLFYIHVPSEPSAKPAIKFTVSTYDTSVEQINTSLASSITTRPPSRYFRHPTTPFKVATYATRGHRFLSIHVSHHTNATCIGFSVPHGVFDGIGTGMLANAISNELAGRDWTPPPFAGYNIITEAIRAIPPNKNKPEIAQHIEREWLKFGLRSAIQAWAVRSWERWWWSVETNALYLHKSVVKKLVDPIKEELKTKGTWVPTGDILVAWFVKMVLTDEMVLSNQVSLQTIASFRSLLAKYEPLAEKTPHNCIMECPMELLTRSQIASMSIAELAKYHRGHIAAVYQPSTIRAIADHLGPPSSSPPLLPLRRFGRTVLSFSNYCSSDMSTIDFGGGTSMVGAWPYFGPSEADHETHINRLGEGYTFTSALRKSRWRTIDRLVSKL